MCTRQHKCVACYRTERTLIGCVEGSVLPTSVLESTKNEVVVVVVGGGRVVPALLLLSSLSQRCQTQPISVPRGSSVGQQRGTAWGM